MTGEEFKSIRNMLYGAYGMLTNDAENQSWYLALQRYDLRDVRQAINDYITLERWKPAIADIVKRTEDVILWKKQRPDIYTDTNVRTYKCPVCRDLGFVEFTSPEGRSLSRPCGNCEAGERKRFLWSPEGEQEWIRQEQAKGRHPQPSFRAPREYSMRVNYGEGS